MFLFNHKNRVKNIIIIMVFALLTISITKNISQIYEVTSRKHVINVPIIMYHHVRNTQLGKDCISPYEFESDLKYLSQNNYNTITISDLINYVYDDITLPDNPIILSFDDGYFNTYRYVFPLLQEYHMKIVLSIVGKVVDDFSRVHDENITYAHVSWNQINEMVQSGLVEIQNHSYNLHKIGNRYGCGQKNNESLVNYEKAINDDVTTFQTHLEQMTGITVNTFTYPYGKYNNNTEQILKNLGYKATMSCQFGVNLISKNPEKLYGLKRICRAHNHSICSLIREGMETLKYSKE
jgi:peptidoglycan/xylan/chitin deacetylase (PgdA/CDA1 family)